MPESGLKINAKLLQTNLGIIVFRKSEKGVGEEKVGVKILQLEG